MREQQVAIDGDDSVRAPQARHEHLPAEYLGRAAAAGRTDVLAPSGLQALQRIAGNSGVTEVLEQERSPVLDVIGSGGRPLESGLRTEMESRLGHDFSDVRVHDDTRAEASAAAVNAHAYTVGNEVVLGSGFDPNSQHGRLTMAHELTHVVQQRSGPVDGTPTGDGVSVSDPSDRFEQEAVANAARVMSDPSPAAAPLAADATTAVGAAVQREESEPELDLQATVQAQEDLDQDEELPS
jgi:hypothetical protein